MTISSKSIGRLKSELFGKMSFDGKTYLGGGAKKQFAKKVFGGSSKGRTDKILRGAGMDASKRAKLFQAIEGKKKTENSSLERRKEQILRFGMARATQGGQNNSTSSIYNSRYKFGSYGGGDKTSVAILGGVGSGVKGSAQDLIKK